MSEGGGVPVDKDLLQTLRRTVGRRGRPPANPCGTCKPIRIGYMDFHEDAEKRDQKGQVQRECPECGRWRWPDELGEVAE